VHTRGDLSRTTSDKADGIGMETSTDRCSHSRIDSCACAPSETYKSDTWSTRSLRGGCHKVYSADNVGCGPRARVGKDLSGRRIDRSITQQCINYLDCLDRCKSCWAETSVDSSSAQVSWRVIKDLHTGSDRCCKGSMPIPICLGISTKAIVDVRVDTMTTGR
jgi:hypothetical protein